MAVDILGFLPGAIDATVVLTQVMQVGVTLGIVAVVAFVLFRSKLLYKYPVEIEIWKIMSDKTLRAYDTDRARRVKKKDGEEYYDVKKRNFKWYPPTFQSQLIKSDGKKVKIYVRELSHNEWELIDPSKLFKTSDGDFRKLQDEGTIRFWKNVEDAKADVKWKVEDRLKQFLDMMPTIIMLVGIGLFVYLFGNHVVIPVLNTFSMINTQSVEVLQKASDLVERSTQYVEMLMQQSNTSFVPAWVNTTNASVIA